MKSTSQGTYGRIEQRSEVKRQHTKCAERGGARTGVENRCLRQQNKCLYITRICHHADFTMPLMKIAASSSEFNRELKNISGLIVQSYY